MSMQQALALSPPCPSRRQMGAEKCSSILRSLAATQYLFFPSRPKIERDTATEETSKVIEGELGTAPTLTHLLSAMILRLPRRLVYVCHDAEQQL